MPDFGSREYWEARFTKDPGVFDWLLQPQAFREVVSEWIEDATLKNGEILNIGCGTSEALLRDVVKNPRQIHNVDYSRAAIDAARVRERDLMDENADKILIGLKDKHDSVESEPIEKMRWSCLDVLSLDSTLSLLEQQAEIGKLFDVVLDKSTSDSIACGPDVLVKLPYHLSINGWTRGVFQSGMAQSVDIHPLNVLAVHLAALTRPKTGKWIVISYSEDRFPFLLPPFAQSASHGFLPDIIVKAGFTHPRQLWRLETKEKIDSNAKKEETLAQRKKRLASGNVYRPQLSYWLYVLVRTEALVTD